MTFATQTEHAVQTGVVLIPLNKLKKSPKNARRTPHGKAEVEALAASIGAKGILQNLVVEPELDDDGAPSGFFFVSIGEGRRLAQMLRVKRKQIPSTEPIRCVIDTSNDAFEISLDENVTRSAMSVMDEVEAFAELVGGGMSADNVARRFGCSLRLVEQRLALARLSPRIRAAYRKGDINLDVARAFCITDDHAAQERIFRQFGKPITHAQSVRNALTQGRIPAHDRLARFVGVEAYEAVGGRVVSDLFEDGVIFFDDGDLLHRLASERAEELRNQLAEEGWGWTAIQLGHVQVEGCAGERLQPRRRKPTTKEKKEITALEERLSELDDKLEDATDDNPLWQDREDTETQLAAVHAAGQVWDRSLMAHAGVIVAVDRDGKPVVTRGLIKRADLRTINRLRNEESPSRREDESPDDAAPSDNAPSAPRLSKALVANLTQARTRGVRAALAQNPHVALGLLVHVLMRRSINRMGVPGVGVDARPIGFDDDDGFERTRIAFAAQAPEDDAALFAACIGQPIDALLGALAALLAETINLIHGGLPGEDKRLQCMGDALAAALDLDMTQYWEADQDFWEKAPKALTIAALETAPSIVKLGDKERLGKIAALSKMKKEELARTAAQTLRGAGWLPDLLITPTHEGAFAITPEGESALAHTDAA